MPAFTSTPLTISWTSTGGTKAYLGVDTTDAQAEPFESVNPDSGSNQDIDYQCYDSHTYTLTVVGSDGSTASKTVTVSNIGDH
ncbi:hypothetical protein GCM10011399_13590 [Subtercola lobariae]|uniref:Uncharacterized protein n=1 Tax=Subtercola lobariae TaxID=1588641 RepID=A0A917EWB4_9MICO|nr:hypothetical protein GCM10011399_13590 [Subtercola lobariae]